MRCQEKPGFAIGDALGVDATPPCTRDAERFEQLLLCEIECALSRLFGNQGREHIWISTVVVKLTSRRTRHRLAEGELGNNRTLFHSHQALIRRVALSLPLYPRGHIEQGLDSHCPLIFIHSQNL